MKNMMIALALVLLLGCTQQERARNWDGKSIINLPAKQKLINATWKYDNIWLLTRQMRPDEKADTYNFKESSSFGILEGEVTIVERE